MQMSLRSFIKAWTLCSASVLSTTGFCHEAGDFILRAGAAAVAPHESSGLILPAAVSPGGRVSIDSDTQLGLTATYMLSSHWGVEVLAATPFTHTVSFAGDLAGLGSLATAEHLPPTVSLQYYFDTGSAAYAPYVGAGINYTLMLETRATTNGRAVLDAVGTGGNYSIAADDSFGLALQAGIDYHLSDRVLLNAVLWYIDIDTTIEVANTLAVDVDIDPLVSMLGIAYKF